MTFTKLEQTILNGLSPFEADEISCDIELLEDEIYDQTGGTRISPNTLRGAIASLVKKEILTVDEGLIYRID